MLDLLFSLSLSFLCGFLVKAVDYLEDDKKSKSVIRFVAAAAYGFVIGLIISFSSFSLIFIAAFLAQFVSKKIDNSSHYIGCLIAILSITLFWNGSILSDLSTNIFPFIFLLAMAVLDELSDDIKSKQLGQILKHRPFLKIGSAIFLLYSRFDYFLGIVLFDLGYELFSCLASNLVRKKPSKRALKR